MCCGCRTWLFLSQGGLLNSGGVAIPVMRNEASEQPSAALGESGDRRRVGRVSFRGVDAVTRSSFVVAELRGGEARRPHFHATSEEVMYVLEGEGWLWESGLVSAIHPRDVIYVPARTAHCCFPQGESLLALACYFPDADALGARRECGLVIGHPER